MSRSPLKKSLGLGNIELVKSTYKLTPPYEMSWGALGSQLKIQQAQCVEASVNNQTYVEQVSSNPFIKTKQLFKNKSNSSSLAEQDERCQILIELQQPQIDEEEEKNFQFDSFGAQNNNNFAKDEKLSEKYLSNPSSQGIKGWNSSSLEINFEKAYKEQLFLPQVSRNNRNQPKFNCLEDSIVNESSIKQFCYRLNDTNPGSIEKTPIKKWSQNKKIRDKAIQTENALTNKSQLRQYLLNFIDEYQNIPEENFRESILSGFQTLINGCKEKRRSALKQMCNLSLQTSKRLHTTDDDENSTLRLYTEDCRAPQLTQRRQRASNNEYRYSGKFKVYECHSKKKQEKLTPTKLQGRKTGTNNKQKRFRF